MPLVMLISVFGLCFTWPVLEALVSEGEPRAGLQHMVGIYNVVWAITGAVSYFMGGALLDKLGMQTLFYIPMGMLIGQLALTFWLQSRARQAGLGGLQHGAQSETEEIPPARTGAHTDVSKNGVAGKSVRLHRD
jgi:MFS family permease